MDQLSDKDIENIFGGKIENVKTNTDNYQNDNNETRKGVSNNKMPKYIKDSTKYDMPAGGGDFLKLEDGANKIRLCTEALEVGYHEDKSGGKYSTTVCQDEACELCKAGKPRKYKYAFLVLNRKDGKPYVYESPISVFRQIVALEANPEYGDIRKYDITVNKSGIARNTVYNITPSPKKSEITEDEEKMIANSGVSLETSYELKDE